MTAMHHLRDELSAFLGVVHDACAARLRQPALDSELVALLEAALTAHRARAVGLAAHPAALLLLVARAEGRPIDAPLREAAVGFTLEYLALCLIDDVADDELTGLARTLGPAVTVNAGLALYTLALDALHAASHHAPADLRADLRRCMCEHSLRAATGQHRDLRRREPASPGEAAEQIAAKTALIAEIAEFTALLCGAAPQRARAIAAATHHSCLMRQIVNDIRDLFGKPDSGDLRDDRATLPILCFRQTADPASQARLASLRTTLPASLPEIRKLLVDSGAITATARIMERARQALHADARALNLHGGPFDLYLEFADAMADQVYRRPSAAA